LICLVLDFDFTSTICEIEHLDNSQLINEETQEVLNVQLNKNEQFGNLIQSQINQLDNLQLNYNENTLQQQTMQSQSSVR